MRQKIIDSAVITTIATAVGLGIFAKAEDISKVEIKSRDYTDSKIEKCYLMIDSRLTRIEQKLDKVLEK